MSSDPQAPAFSAAPAPAPAPKQGTSGLAVAGLILAFLIAPLGFLLSLIAVFKTGKGRAGGRGLAITGVVLGLVFSIGGGVVIAKALDKVTTIADPGCTLAKSAINDNEAGLSNSTTITATLPKVIAGLTDAEAKAKHDDVRAAVKVLKDDYTAALEGVNTGKLPDDFVTKSDADTDAFNKICSLEGGN
jgi:hypothetical protein